MAWHFFLVNHHKQFVKGDPLWQGYRLQWHVYMAELWPSTIDNTGNTQTVTQFNIPSLLEEKP
ncbi:hypothetical protein GLYMA_03G064900v4 [Glycine max]|uniref:Uncharacterized protein n=1 Tax=Glycine max TaxID=3847 RepID=A0A0R0KFH5_SOYBN|nr:hypothetical protein GYH30_006411 [Glycine max]KRH65830.1 hypothetical protein GLYMA_03G064900v4 [Glycine max]